MGPIAQSVEQRTFNPWVDSSSLSGPTNSEYSLRKTYAYFLKTNDVHVTTAAKFLGHSDPMVTLKTYTTVLDNEVEHIGTKLRVHLSQFECQL